MYSSNLIRKKKQLVSILGMQRHVVVHVCVGVVGISFVAVFSKAKEYKSDYSYPR